MLRKGSIVLSMLSFAMLVLVLLLNVAGWRERVLKRVLRVDNGPTVVSPPANFQPRVPPGFKVSVFAEGFQQPRWLAVAPNGDVFVADSAAGGVVVLRDHQAQNQPATRELFADHLNLPFGIAFHENFVYVANTNEVVRLPYDPASSKRLGTGEHILNLPGLGYNQRWTRSLAFSNDGKRLFVSIGSKTNVSIESDPRRAAVLLWIPRERRCKSMLAYCETGRHRLQSADRPIVGDRK
jgi:glucose/arabinose dehydrogenase